MTKNNDELNETRSVGAALGIGILLVPFVFAWFTLRKGYGKAARIVSLGWMALVLVIALAANLNNSEQPTVLEGDPPMDEATSDALATDDENGTAANNLEGQASNFERNFDYIYVKDGKNDEVCSMAKNVASVEASKVKCVADRKEWKALCSAVHVVNGNATLIDAAKESLAKYAPINGQSNNTSEALLTVVQNNGVQNTKIYWNENQADTEKSCQLEMNIQGMYQGTNINDSILGFVTEILVMKEGGVVVVSALPNI